MKKHERKISIGEHFRDQTAYWSQWEVVRIFVDHLNTPHAALASLFDATDRRTIACAILADQKRYELIQDDQPSSSTAVVSEDLAMAVGFSV